MIQRYYNVSWATTLVRLKQAGVISRADYDSFQHIRPMQLARTLGYEAADEEFGQPATVRPISRFPRRFVRLVRLAIQADVVSVPTVASHTGLTIDEVAALLPPHGPTPETHQHQDREFEEYESTGVFA